MNITSNQLIQEVGLARTRGWLSLFAQAEKRHDLPSGLLLAIASRETNMQDIVGDSGHGRGVFQIDDRSHGDFLSKHGAGGPGGKPPVDAAADYAAAIVAAGLAFGKSKGVGGDQLVKFACSAYNAGAGNAWAGFQEGDSDKRTTGCDYGSDVLERLAAIGGSQGANGGGSGAAAAAATPLLKNGFRGPQVITLKSDLKAWFDVTIPGEWHALGVDSSDVFGDALERAVREFQQRNGLEVDGKVGSKTSAALATAAENARRSRVAPT
jgi:uncharacterized protein YfiM (DUF2279 family)